MFTIDLSSCSITPNRESLSGTNIFKCWMVNCPCSFTKLANLDDHIRKFHKNVEIKDRKYFCPEEKCIYNIKNQDRSFNSFKGIKQHYLKVHSEKTLTCGDCNKGFASEKLLKSHEKVCGLKYDCQICNSNYVHKESLVNHIRRKHDNYEQLIAEKKMNILKQVSTQTVMPLKTCITQETQTEVVNKRPKNEIAIQTEIVMAKSTCQIQNSEEAENSNLVDSSSQTQFNYFEDSLSCFSSNQFDDPILCTTTETQTEVIGSIFSGDPMLYTNMHTQTCDDILSELGLTNDFVSTETQTNWNFDSCLLMPSNSSSTQTSQQTMEFLNELEYNSIHTQTS